jgi:hypothetical protein
MNPSTTFVFAALLSVGAAQAQQNPAADPLQVAAERLAKSLAQTADLPSCAFDAKWGPAKKPAGEDDEKEGPAAGLGFVTPDATGSSSGTWSPGLLHCKAGDDELLFANRRLLAKSAANDWTLRGNRFADGAALSFMPDPQLLLDLLCGFKLAVTQREVGTLNDRPVEILSATLDEDQVANLMWGGQLPEASTGFGNVFIAVAAGGAGAARPAPTKPTATVDVAFLIDPATGQVHQIRLRSWAKNELNVGGRVIKMGGAGRVVFGGATADDEEDDEDEKAKEAEGKPVPLVYKDGLPERPRKKMLVTDLTVSFTEHGQAKPMVLDDKFKALLRAR